MHIPLIGSYVNLVRNNRDYRFLWLSQVVSLTGDWFTLIASATLVANLSGSGLAIGGLFLARLLPPFVLGPLAGVIADRFDRLKILIATDLLRAVVVLNFLFVHSAEDVWLLYVLTVLQLSISSFFEPTRAAVMPSIVARHDLVTANALDGTTWSTMLALGAALGGIAAATLGISAAFIIDAATFVLSAWFVARITRTAARPSTPSSAEVETTFGGFVAGVRYLWQRPATLVLALVKASSSLAFGGIAVVEVMFAEKVFPLGTDGSATLGLIYLVVGIGTGLGPLVARRITGDNPQAMKWGIFATYVIMFAGYLTMGWAFTLPILLLATFIRTVGTGVNWVYSSSLLQMIVPGNYLGRVFAFDLAIMTLASSTSTLWVGWAQDNLGLGPHQLGMWLAVIPAMMGLGWGVYMTGGLKWLPSYNETV
jgi:Na+/melibiose symporter-like transporter